MENNKVENIWQDFCFYTADYMYLKPNEWLKMSILCKTRNGWFCASLVFWWQIILIQHLKMHITSYWPQQAFNSSFPFYLGKTVIWWGKDDCNNVEGTHQLALLQTSANTRIEMNRVNAKKVMWLTEISFFFYLLTAIAVTHAAICSCFLTWSCAFWAGKCRNSRKKKMIHKYSDFVGWHHGACHLYPQSGIWLLPSCMSPHRWAITTVLSVHLYTVTTSRITIWL